MRKQNSSVSVIGLGYIGLPTAAVIAGAGYDVKGCDIRKDIIDLLNSGQAHFSEPDLDDLVEHAAASGALKAFATPQPADTHIITVPTPVMKDHSPDMSFVNAATHAIASVLKSNDMIILESTSPIGTTRGIGKTLESLRPDLVKDGRLALSIAYCPERILPGQMVRELVENDRIIGGLHQEDADSIAPFYKSFVSGGVYETDASTAELVKLIENASRDIDIAFANEVGAIAKEHGIEIWDAIALANKHPRVNILSPGPGVGGHCIAVDPWFLISQHPERTALMTVARNLNDQRPLQVADEVRAAVKAKEPESSPDTTTVNILGLAYKPNVDDMRESPSLRIVEQLSDDGYQINVVEPNVDTLPEPLCIGGNVRLISLDEALTNDSLLVVCVKHREFVDNRFAICDQGHVDTVGLFAS